MSLTQRSVVGPLGVFLCFWDSWEEVLKVCLLHRMKWKGQEELVQFLQTPVGKVGEGVGWSEKIPVRFLPDL